MLIEVEGFPKNGQQRAQICKTLLKPFRDICAPVPDEQDVSEGKGTVDLQKQKEASVSVKDEDGLDEENETGFDGRRVRSYFYLYYSELTPLTGSLLRGEGNSYRRLGIQVPAQVIGSCHILSNLWVIFKIFLNV